MNLLLNDCSLQATERHAVRFSMLRTGASRIVCYLLRKPDLMINTATGPDAKPTTVYPIRYLTAFSTGSKVAMKPNMQKASSIKKPAASNPQIIFFITLFHFHEAYRLVIRV